MPSTMPTQEAVTSVPSAAQDEIILSRPRGVYTGEYSLKRRNASRGGADSSATGNYNRVHHEQGLTRGIQAILRSKKADTKAKTPTAVPLEGWTPQISPLGARSRLLEDLCLEFAQLATELQDGWTE
ncbi:hypothetical protein VPNG_01187 [Cytospora leucostoma]|uniref:Uncharacterized protein n=1 Tax=Cytospora leucostoma TaxID=1230097 RepID=A0A423XL74_9PEZI|nr:hypothetical protein VPNG_01187 [Cytospora leucostoma]